MHTSNGYILDDSPNRLGELTRTPNAERHNREALWDRLRRQGYLFLPGQLDPQIVQAFRSYYFGELVDTGLLARGIAPDKGIAAPAGPLDQGALRESLFRRIVPSLEYHQFCTQPAIQDWFRWFLEDEVHLHRRKILRHHRPGESGPGTATQAHYDLVYLREGTDRVLSMWIPLGDCTVAQGGLTYLESSHRWVLAEEAAGRLPHPASSITADLPSLADKHDARWLLADYSMGDILVHSAHTVHASLDNVDENGRIRLSTDIRYQRLREPIDWRWQQDWHSEDGL